MQQLKDKSKSSTPKPKISEEGNEVEVVKEKIAACSVGNDGSANKRDDSNSRRSLRSSQQAKNDSRKDLESGVEPTSSHNTENGAVQKKMSSNPKNMTIVVSKKANPTTETKAKSQPNHFRTSVLVELLTTTLQALHMIPREVLGNVIAVDQGRHLAKERILEDLAADQDRRLANTAAEVQTGNVAGMTIDLVSPRETTAVKTAPHVITVDLESINLNIRLTAKKATIYREITRAM